MANRKILIVEDEPEIRNLLNIALTDDGFDVYEATDMQEAITQFDAVEPDLILLDIGPPATAGLETCAELRSYSNAPIVLISSRSGSSDIIQGLELGADDYIVKRSTPRCSSPGCTRTCGAPPSFAEIASGRRVPPPRMTSLHTPVSRSTRSAFKCCWTASRSRL